MERTSRTQDAAILLASAVVCFAAFYWIGSYVSVHGEPAALSAFAHAMRGRAVGLAWVLTNMCYPFVLAPLAIASLALGIAKPHWRPAAFTIVVVTLLCWGGADWFQHFFMRPRPSDWLVKHERAFSYPSSHAAIATGFYFYWGLVIVRSSLSKGLRYSAFATLVLLTVAIMWSRLSLAAHYPTDLIGGVLLCAALIMLVECSVLALETVKTRERAK